MTIKLKQGKLTELGEFKHFQVEIVDMSDELKQSLLACVKRIVKEKGYEPHDLDCQILVEGMFKIVQKKGE